MKHEICPIPFSTLIFNPDGSVGCCRELTSKDIIGHMNDFKTLDDIWNNEIIRKWRREFLHGIPEKCKRHMDTLQCHKSGMNQALSSLVDFQEYQQRPPLMISPDFNGKCNLQCIMCDVWSQPNNLYDIKWNFWKTATKEIFPFIKYIDPLAGEPFIQKDLYKLINIISAINSSAIWRFTTNGQWRFSPYIIQHLNKINIESFQYSIDGGTSYTYERIRKGGSLRKLLSNIEDNLIYKKDYKKRYKLLSLTVVMKNNWQEIPTIINLMEDRGVIPYFTFCNNFPQLQIDTYDTKQKEIIINFLLNNTKKIQYIHRLINWIISTMPIEYQKKYNKILLLNSVTH